MRTKAVHYKDRPAPDHADPSTWLRRREVAAILRCSIQTVHNHEHRGILHGRNIDGFRLFDPIEVEMLRTRITEINRAARNSKLETRGDVEAAVYRMLDAGATRNEIVKILHITADEAQRIWAAYRITEFDKAEEISLQRSNAEKLAQAEQHREQQRLARRQRLQQLINGGAK